MFWTKTQKLESENKELRGHIEWLKERIRQRDNDIKAGIIMELIRKDRGGPDIVGAATEIYTFIMGIEQEVKKSDIGAKQPEESCGCGDRCPISGIPFPTKTPLRDFQEKTNCAVYDKMPKKGLKK